MKVMLSLQDIMKRTQFENAEIVAGEKGMDRHVKWVHVVEVTNIEKLLNGQELILSTGVSFGKDTSEFRSFVQQLINCKAAGLAIEKGAFIPKIPQEIIDFANKEHFPLILFQQEVSFVDITQDIHSVLINQQYQMITQLENYSQSLNKKLLTITHEFEILTYLHEHINAQIIYENSNHERLFIPDVPIHDRKKYICRLQSANSPKSSWKQPVFVMEKQYGIVHIFTDERSISEFDHLLLDRTLTALAQHILRGLYVEEKRKLEESEWLRSWLEGGQTKESIREFLMRNESFISKGAMVLLCKKRDSKSPPLDKTYLTLLIRSNFEHLGFTVFFTEMKNTLTVIMLNSRDEKDWKERLRTGVRSLLEKQQDKKGCTFIRLSAGKYVQQLNHLSKSFQSAMETLQIQEQLLEHEDFSCFEDLHIYRLISFMQRHHDLRDFVMEYLEPVIKYDQKHNGKLLETLKVYLACNGSKKETAGKLYIVRQTLYHRIQKLETLLGEDFMIAEKRLVIEFMVMVYEYLHTTTSYLEGESKSFSQ
ncbi:PucR family transcriptional regulator [Sutcliffiella rhizosphaerae]|uniref:Purine catabolism regulatory protein n=1 Tax=Sutcliffiella rhizosphaerae TaxID=2880967 RepID=A0ABM8YI34_9BACI|nr:PucR family transcriptional regulator [Sutcliffiella rhizosphaerae]CAG9619432.1 Purine catabolism regulatory protein [Sutcliffiella rhizosphaerae]